MSRWVCTLLLLGGLVRAQTPAPPSFAANEAGGGVAKPTEKTGAGPNLDLPTLPAGKATVLGGTIRSVDHLRDRMILQIYGGGRTVVIFDARTRVYRDGKAASLDDLKNGDRIYADTVLDGTKIFARKISLATLPASIGRADGQVVSFEPTTGQLTLRDSLSLAPLRLNVTAGTVILREDRPASPAELRPGALVAAVFLPGSEGHITVRQISILASPGTEFTFAGRVEHLDLHRGLLVLLDPRDNKSYEMHIDPSLRSLPRQLREGSDVTVAAGFDGRRYAAKSITLNPPSSR